MWRSQSAHAERSRSTSAGFPPLSAGFAACLLREIAVRFLVLRSPRKRWRIARGTLRSDPPLRSGGGVTEGDGGGLRTCRRQPSLSSQTHTSRRCRVVVAGVAVRRGSVQTVSVERLEWLRIWGGGVSGQRDHHPKAGSEKLAFSTAVTRHGRTSFASWRAHRL